MGLGLGARIGEYKSPEVQCGLLRRPYSSLSSDYNNINASCVDINSDSSNERFFRADWDVLEDNDKITVSIQFNSDDVALTRLIVSIEELVGTDRCITIYHRGNFVYAVATNDNWTSKVGIRSSSLSDDTWYQIIAVFDLSTPSVKLVVNGVSQTTSSTTGSIHGDNTSLGRATHADGVDITDTFYVGKLRQLAIWRDELTTAQQKALWFGGSPRSPLCIARGGHDRYPGTPPFPAGTTATCLLLYIPVIGSITPFEFTDKMINLATFNYAGNTSLWRGGIGQVSGVVSNGGLVGYNDDPGDYQDGYLGE